MKLYKVFILMFVFSFSLSSYAQSEIGFDMISVEAGISKAKENGKFLFVDTYAEWCIPCKKMKHVFEDKEVAAFFNNNYINIKINMDGPYGKDTYNDYDVVFLPTMMIFDQKGRLKYKTDKLLTAQELLDIGKKANVEGVYLGNDASQIVSSPFQSMYNSHSRKVAPIEIAKETVKKKPTERNKLELESISEGQIVKVLDANEKMPPEVLYQEAYFQMQTMNDSHGEAAITYLKTQKDWSTKKNVKFIFDFVESTNSILFDYIQENRDHVASIVGESNLSYSLRILVNQRIYQGFPRPNLEEAIALYNLVNTSTAKQDAYQYYLGRMQQEDNKKEYLTIVNKYLFSIAPNDHSVMNKAVEVYTTLDYEEGSWKNYKKQIQKAIDLNPKEARYYVTLAKLYLMKGDRKRAKKSIENALEIMNENTGDLDSEINDVLQRISKS